MKTRLTNQRKKVLDYLKSVKTHPNAEQVYLKVKKEMLHITLATVYRNLNLLAEQGEILRLEINKEYRYDADTSFHQHLVCKKCNLIINSFQTEISNYAMNKINHPKFEPEKVIVIFEGTCSACQD